MEEEEEEEEKEEEEEEEQQQQQLEALLNLELSLQVKSIHLSFAQNAYSLMNYGTAQTTTTGGTS